MTHDLILVLSGYGAGVAATVAGVVLSEILGRRHHVAQEAGLVPEQGTTRPWIRGRRFLPTPEELAAEKMALAARLLTRHRHDRDGTTW